MLDAGPLDGVRVVDFTQAASGPFCTQQLGDLGAEVIKVEPPSGDMIRGWDDSRSAMVGTYFMGLNRNKRFVCLDLKDTEQRRLARRLCDRADVVVANLRPGKMDALGLGYQELASTNPRLVYLDITAFGEVGPLRDVAGMDITLQAFGGIMGLTGEEGGGPVKVGAPVADLATGYAAVGAVLAALYQRERTGKGQRVSVSMLKVVVSLFSNHATGALMDGRDIPRMGSGHPQLVPYQAFRTAGDDWIIVGILNEEFWRKLCNVLGRTDWLDDPRYRTNRNRVANRARLIALLEPIFAERSLGEWTGILAAADVPHTAVNTLTQLFEHPQVAMTGVVRTVPHEVLGSIPVVAYPADFGAAEVIYRLGPGRLGRDTEAVLSELAGPPEVAGDWEGDPIGGHRTRKGEGA